MLFRSSPELLEQVADEAARLMAEHGVPDFGLAKRKAAERLGVSVRGVLPSNAQIQECLVARQRLFEPDEHAAMIARMRRVAADLMQTLEEFRPRLVGPVLEGTATINTAPEELPALWELHEENVRAGFIENGRRRGMLNRKAS